MLAAVLSKTAERLWACPGYPSAANYAATLLAMIFGVTHTMILHFLADGDCLLLQDGLGWQIGMVGRTLFDAGMDTFAGLTLSSETPVIIEDLRTETRFPIPTALLGNGLISGLCTKIPYEDGAVGLLAVFSKEPRNFNQTEITCLDMVAGMLSVSVGCRRIEETLKKDQERIEQAKLEWEATVDALPHFICLLDEHRHIVRANRSIELWVRGMVRDIRGRTVHDVLHPECQDPACYMLSKCHDAWDDVMHGRHVVFEVDDKVLKRKLEIQLRPTTRRSSVNTPPTSMAVMVMHDITRIKHAEELLKNSNNQLEDLVRERTNELQQTNEQLWSEIMERRRVEDELRQSENDMHLLSAQLLTAQEMERKRIAAELHDGISQSLTAIKFSIESIVGRSSFQNSGEQDSLIKTTLTRIQTAVEEVRRICTNLRPSMLDDLGVIPTIAWFCREFRAIYHDINLDTYIDISESDVPAALKTVIYRILQESLNNIVKHSMAQNVRVHFRQHNSAIEFLVQDDGHGFDQGLLSQREKSRKGSGLASMRERAEFSGGSFSIRSEQGTGTTIRAVWPIHA